MKKLKILFQEPIEPRNVVFGQFSAGAGNNTFPFGVASIAAYVAERGYDVSYLDPAMEKMTEEGYLKYLKEGAFDLVGIGATTPQAGYAVKTFELIKRHFPGMVTVMGGVHVTCVPEGTLKGTDAVDYAVLGEGEKPFLGLIDCLGAGKKEDIRAIRGVAFKEDGKISVNQCDEKDYLAPGELPAPLFDIFPMDQYVAQATYAKTFPTYSLLASRGCPYRCTFCISTAGKRQRYRPVDAFIGDIATLKEKYGARGLIFMDDIFTGSRAWVEEFCEKYLASGTRLPWACNSRVDTIDKELLEKMRSAGCWLVLMGIESANQKSLDRLKKDTTVEQNERAIKMAMELGFCVYASYIICLPGEDEKDAMNTISFARRMGNHLSLFFLPVPLPGTELEEQVRRDGGLRENARFEDYNQFDFTDLVYVNPLIGEERMKYLLRKAFISFYTSPVVLYRNLKELALLRQHPYRYWLGIKSLAGYLRHGA